jgi:uncharacterized membrane protein YphA (DoxX/SURF4 family)
MEPMQQSSVYPSGQVHEPNVGARKLEAVPWPPVRIPLPRETEQSFQVLRGAFTIAPLLAGSDKFFHLLTNWDQYVSPLARRLVQGHDHQAMWVAGGLEIAAGIGVAFAPRIFGYVLSAWMFVIAFNLILIPDFLDIALCDVGLGLAAFALGRLATLRDRTRYGA